MTDPAVNLWPPDHRGEIRQMNVHGHKVNIIFTKAGAARSGDVHPTIQHDMIITGRWEVTLREHGKERKFIAGPNEHVQIPPHTPHIFLCLEDSLMAEWWDGEMQYEYDPEYRAKVNQINEELKRSTS